MGSAELIQTLMEHNLINRYVLLIHLLILGTGLQLFRDGSSYSALHRLSAKGTPKGVVVATYESAGATTT
jgi:dihydrofolate reductase